MATVQQLEQFRQVLNQLSVVSYAAVKRLVAELDHPDAAVLRDRLFAAYPELVAPFVAAAGEVAAQWYSDLRASSDAPGSFAPVMAATVPADQARGIVFRSMTPRFDASSSSTVVRMLSGSTQRLISGGARGTIEASAHADRKVGYQRMPAPGCCAFCGLMASRGPIYRSAGSAGVSVTYHDFCSCLAVPVFVGDTEINGVLRATRQQYAGMYDQSVGRDANGSTALKPTLANWRATFGTK